MKFLKEHIGVIIKVIITLAIVAIIFMYFKQVTSFAVMMLLVDAAFLQLYFVDVFVLRGYDTIEELKKGNVAVGLALCAYAIVSAAAIIAAFLAWA